MGKILSRSYQTIQHNPQTQKEPKDVIVWEKVPKRRKWWRAWLFSIFICLSCAIGIIYHGFAESKITEYKPVSDLSTSTKLEAIKNRSIECYTKEEKISYTVFVNLGLGLLAIMLGTLVDRLSLVFEELFHFKRRYNRNICKMLKACFSGISLGAVVVVILIVVISTAVPLATKSTFDLKHATYILSGIGVGPLVMHLLNLTQSEVHISTILEEKETYVAHGLAWSYYFNYLDNALPKFEEKFPNNSSGIPVQDQGQQVRLSLNKLILLISHNCITTKNLEEQDNKIKKLGEITNGKHIFPVYRLTYNNTEYRYVIKYVMQPLETLQKMSLYERIPSFHEKELEYQVKFFFKTLSDILKKPFNNKHREKCILVPIKAESSKSLNNGGLVHFIMHKVTEDQSTSDQENGFMMVPPAQKTLKTAEPKTTEDDTSALDGKTVGLTSSHTVDIDPVEATAHYSKQKEDHLSSLDNEDENSAIFHPAEERGNRRESKQPERQYGKSCQNERETMLHNDYEKHAIRVDVRNNPSQAGESKGTQTISGSHSMSSNLENGRENSPREDEYEESDFTCDSPLIPNGTGETENTSMSSIADRRENCPREDADNAGPAPSYNPPVSDHTGENEDQPTSAYVHDGGENSPRREEDTTSMSSPSIAGRAEL